MMTIDAKELWRQIPPEEKLELMSRAHAKGVTLAVITIIIMSTIAVGLHQPWMLWTSLMVSPLVFQLAAGKEWRALRPRTMLEHLAVRSAARRFAFSYKAKDLGLVAVIRGDVKEKFEEDKIEDALEALEEAAEKNLESAAWIALFNDAVVAISERSGGAECKMGHLINKKMTVTSNSPSGKEYSQDHEVLITFDDNNGKKHTYVITSRYPASLIVFEKKLKSLLDSAQSKQEEMPALDDNEADLSTLWGAQE